MMGRPNGCSKPLLATCLATALFTFVACADNEDRAAGDATEKSSTDPAQAALAEEMTRQQQVEFARQDLASRLGLELAAINVSRATVVTWRSGALGCPEPDMNYTMALVPGIRIVLQADNSEYRYHGVSGSEPFYCPAERAEEPAVESGDT